MTRPTVTACLIVKNEAENLPRCLASLQGWVDEVVVVDTGSTDETVAIAESSGATLGHFTWCDDFAAARNAALELATSDWVFTIDADEELHVDDPTAWHAALGTAQALALTIENLSPAGQVENSFSALRLARRQPTLRYSGRVHEEWGPALAALGWSIAELVGVRLRHHGYTPGALQRLDKPARNAELARKMVEEQPTDPLAWYHLVRSLWLCRDVPATLVAIEQLEGLQRVGHALDAGRRQTFLLVKAWVCKAAERRHEALAALTLGLDTWPEFPEYHYERALLLSEAGELEAAIADLEACLNARCRGWAGTVRRGVTGYLAHVELAALHHRLGNLSEMASHLRTAADDPDCPADEARQLRQVADQLPTEPPRDDRHKLLARLERNPRDAQAFLELAFNCYQQGQLDRALVAVSQAIELNAGRSAGYHLLGLVLEALDQPGYAGQAFACALQLDPEHPSALECRLRCRRKQPSFELAPDQGAQLERLFQRLNPTVSACLIVKNEAENLPRCLASLKGWVDEMVVVDTGSTDDTVAIAESFGAKVGHFAWCDDFSAARNAALELATSDWVLTIDADEELVVADGELLRQELRNRIPGAYSLRLENHFETDVVTEASVIRLIHRLPATRYVGRLHETVEPTLAPQGLVVYQCDGLRLLHHGYTNEAMARHDKGPRNVRLAELDAADRPDDPMVLFHLARSYILNGQLDDAQRSYERLDELLATKPLPAAERLLLAQNRFDLYARLGRADETERWLDRCLSEFAGFPEFHYERGKLRYNRGDVRGAIADFEACLAWDGRDFKGLIRHGVADTLPREALALIAAHHPELAPKVSACLIVKNEAENLPRCLASLKGWVDEIVVVDTGSTDETVAIAESFGAKIGHVAWCDDFSAARNAALDLATSDWALVIDADEELVVTDPAAFRQALLAGRTTFNVPIVSVSSDGQAAAPMNAFRLFPTQGGLRYSGRLHESIDEAWLATGPWLQSQLTAAHIRHYGYDAAVMQTRNKHERNLRLAKLQTDDRPTDAIAWFQLTRSYLAAYQLRDALEAYRRMLALGDTLQPDHFDRLVGAIEDLGQAATMMIGDAEAQLRAAIAELPSDFTAPRRWLALARPNAAPTVSACLIVKNEAENLPRCLASLKGWVDEIVVVDTGSTDETVAIAESFGAKVGHFAWCDDFSAARNASLELATSDWALIVDADEELVIQDPEAWRQALRTQRTVFTVPITNVMEDGEESAPRYGWRLFPHHAGLRYNGRIHESIDEAIMATGGWQQQDMAAMRIRHWGYQVAVMHARGKFERNLRIARLEVEERPDNPGAWFHLARTYVSMGRLDEAREAYRRMLALKDRHDPMGIDRLAQVLDELFRAVSGDRPTVGACLIVKNEAENLPRCLASLKGWVDEIVVVDTGSTDETVAIAESCGAKVGHFAWCDDFSAARNAALDLATSDWVLVIDADEELVVADPEGFRQALAGQRGGYVVAIDTVDPSGRTEFQAPGVRLVPRDPHVRFVGRVHESLTEGLASRNWPLMQGGFLTIRHHGYQAAAIEGRRKGERNTRLARLEVADRPHDPIALLNLARSLTLDHRLEEAIATYEQLAALPTELNPHMWVHYALGRQEVLQTVGRLEEAERFLTSALEKFPGHPELLFERGRLRFKLGQPEAARQDFEGCLAAHGHPIDTLVRPGITDALPRQALALLGDAPADERAAVLGRLERNPRDAEAFLELAFLCYQQGQLDRALVAVSQAIELNAGRSAGYHLLGLVLEALDQPGYAGRAFACALQLDPEHPSALECRLRCRHKQSSFDLAPDQAAQLERLFQRLNPTLSACLIVKNEAENLPRCLASLKGWVDEIVVVDTGSTDDTVAIAESFGAKVGHFAWCDDFSAARNAALDLATSDWVLVIDADEELVVDDPEAFRYELRQRAHSAYFLMLANVSAAGSDFEAPVGRLFQRHGAIRFAGRLHETVEASLVALDWPTARSSGARLVHYGYDPEVMRSRGKSERNLRLAELDAADRPDDVVTQMHLARSFLLAQRFEDAEAVYGRIEGLIARGASLTGPAWIMLTQNLFDLYTATGRHPEAERALDRGLTHVPGFAEFLYERGKLRYNRGDEGGAIADFNACLAAHGQPALGAMRQGVTDALPREALARIAAHHPDQATRRPTVSACMIVKNEAASLPRCLASLKGWVDEIVVVDTGSTDDTVAIAESFGAKVGHFTWCNDFAAARNASLELASSDWVLVIDADEELVVADPESLRQALTDAGHGGYLVAQRNLRDDGSSTDNPLMRLFRRDPRIRYERRLHEDTTDSIQRNGWGVAFLHAIVLNHDGYLKADASSKGKGERNFHIALEVVEAQPDSPAAWYDLGRSSLYYLGTPDEALAAFQQVERLLAEGKHLGEIPYCNFVGLYARLLRSQQRDDEAQRLLDEALRRVPGFPEFHYERGRLRMELGDAQGARADFEACLRPLGRAYPAAIRPEIVSTLPRQALAQL